MWESLQRNQVPFGCLRTCRAWGPDDDLAAPELCTADRPCFERDPTVGSGPGTGDARIS